MSSVRRSDPAQYPYARRVIVSTPPCVVVDGLRRAAHGRPDFDLRVTDLKLVRELASVGRTPGDLALLLLNAGDDPSQPSHFLHQLQHDPVDQRVTLRAPRSMLSRRSSVRLPTVMWRTYVRSRILSRAKRPQPFGGPDHDVLIEALETPAVDKLDAPGIPGSSPGIPCQLARRLPQRRLQKVGQREA
jgi:hypothetical protein